MMNWKDIKVSADNTHFVLDGKKIFGTQFLEVLKFHSPGIAAVKDETGSYHINHLGTQLYSERFTRTFGFYCNRAAVVQDDKSFHLTDTGKRAYADTYSWIGNFQENFCAVRDWDNKYYHIDHDGNRIYTDSFSYCGDFKNGIACVKKFCGLYQHINSVGQFLNGKEFSDLGIFHKNFATAKDCNGWYHIDQSGNEIYSQRFLAVEPFYNGYALVTQFDNHKIIIDEKGKTTLKIQ